MAEEKKPEKPKADPKDEKLLGAAVDEIHRTLADRMMGRPYLLVVTSGFETGKEGDNKIFAAQWAWRSNVYSNREEGEKLADFLSSQLKDAVEDSEIGIKKSYAKNGKK